MICAMDFRSNSLTPLCIDKKKIVGTNICSEHFIKIICQYKKVGYNINVLQHNACLVVNPIMAGNLLSSLIERWLAGPQTQTL